LREAVDTRTQAMMADGSLDKTLPKN
jgi:hypothetical protein